MKKKIIISVVVTTICIITMVLPLRVNASKKQEWKTVELSEKAQNMLNETTQYSSTSTIPKLPLVTNKNPYESEISEEKEKIDTNNEKYVYSEPSEADKELYKKWAEEQKEYDRKNNIVNDLLNKYYPKEKDDIDEMNLKETEETGRTNVTTSRSKRKRNKKSRINSKIM